MSLNRFGIIDYQQGFGTEFSVDLPSFADETGVEGLVRSYSAHAIITLTFL